MRAPRVMAALVVAGCTTPAPASFELDLGGLPATVAVKTDDGAWTKLAPYAIGPTTTGYLIPFAATPGVVGGAFPDHVSFLPPITGVAVSACR